MLHQNELLCENVSPPCFVLLFLDILPPAGHLVFFPQPLLPPDFPPPSC